jgi:hypothetical protein
MRVGSLLSQLFFQSHFQILTITTINIMKRNTFIGLIGLQYVILALSILFGALNVYLFIILGLNIQLIQTFRLKYILKNNTDLLLSIIPIYGLKYMPQMLSKD